MEIFHVIKGKHENKVKETYNLAFPGMKRKSNRNIWFTRNMKAINMYSGRILLALSWYVVSNILNV